jgi:hypothetical protein
VIKPLVGLRCFNDADPVTLFKFSEYFKDHMKKHEDKKKRSSASINRYQEEFRELTIGYGEDGNGITVPLDSLVREDGENPFDAEDWKLRFDVDEDMEVDKRS